MRILFISNPYLEDAVIDAFEKVTDHSFVLLKSNHMLTHHNKIHNIVFLNLDEALMNCDYIYILSDKNIAHSVVSKCRKVARCSNIGFYYSNIDNRNTTNFKKYLKNVISTSNSQIPNILILQAGIHAQIERTEYNLIKQLDSKDVQYLYNTNSFLYKINNDMKAILNIELFQSEKNSPCLIINTIKTDIWNLIDSKVDNLFFDKFMLLLKPDYIIISCENNFKQKNELKKIFKIKYLLDVDKFIKSEYVTLQKNKVDTAVFIEQIPEFDVFHDIELKLTVPNGISEIVI